LIDTTTCAFEKPELRRVNPVPYGIEKYSKISGDFLRFRRSRAT